MAIYLAYEGGGTRTVAALYDASGRLMRETTGAPCNPMAYGVAECVTVLAGLGQALLSGTNEPVSLIAGVSGAADETLRTALAHALCRRMRLVQAAVATDLHPVLYAHFGTAPGLLAIAGTGACVLGQDGQGHMLRLGGRGALIGDDGSAYQIAVQALRAAARAVDGTGPETRLTTTLPEAAHVVTVDALAEWAAQSSKMEIAALATVVSAGAEAGDDVARHCIAYHAEALGSLVVRARERLDLTPANTVLMHGGVFQHSLGFRSAFEQFLAGEGMARVSMTHIQGHAAVFSLTRCGSPPPWLTIVPGSSVEKLSNTECRDEEERPLESLQADEIVARMNRQDTTVAKAVARQHTHIARAMERAAKALREGGRLLYVGAGTSGRLGVLDASECPPTFGVAEGRVVGVIAGGEAALRHSVEGAEDDCAAGRQAIETHAVAPCDVVIGIAASGTTPYVLAALLCVAERGAATVMITSNPAAAACADIMIATDTGPEVLTGSTRLKAGTAAKMILNMISTGAMALSGYVYRGRMVGMRPVNDKLRARAERMVAELAGVSEERAANLLQDTGLDIRLAILMGLKGYALDQARQTLNSANGILDKALK